jgi:hypothetical protein
MPLEREIIARNPGLIHQRLPQLGAKDGLADRRFEGLACRRAGNRTPAPSRGGLMGIDRRKDIEIGREGRDRASSSTPNRGSGQAVDAQGRAGMRGPLAWRLIAPSLP